MYAYILVVTDHRDSSLPQVPIKAGHEFIITTDDKYSESCDGERLWLDYVGTFC